MVTVTLEMSVEDARTLHSNRPDVDAYVRYAVAVSEFQHVNSDVTGLDLWREHRGIQ